MGAKYVENRQVEFAKSYEESGPGTPIFFILSPGVDPLKDVEALGKKLGFTFDNKNFHNVSLGQVRLIIIIRLPLWWCYHANQFYSNLKGQEIVAEQSLDLAAKEGHWVILQVILPRWTLSCLSAYHHYFLLHL